MVMSLKLNSPDRLFHQDLYLSLLNNTTLGIAYFDPEGCLLFLNPLAAQFLHCSPDIAIGAHVSEILVPDRAEKIMDLIKSTLTKKNKSPLQTRWLYHYFGKVYEIKLKVLALASSQETGTQAFGFLWTNPTFSHDYINEIEKTNFYFNKIIDFLPNPVFIKDKDHRFLSVNQALCKSLGLSQSDLLGKNDYECFTKTEAQTHWENDKKAFISGQITENEESITNHEGHQIHILTRKVVVQQPDQEPILIGISSDISQQKQIEAQLLEAKRKFQGIFNNTFQFMTLLDASGRVLESNQPALDFYAHQLDLIQGQYIWDLQGLSSQSQALMQDYILKANQGQFIRYELTSQGAQGQEMISDFSLKPVYDSENQVKWILAEGRDISEKKQLENELQNTLTLQQAILESMPSAVLYSDLTNRILWANQQAEHQFATSASKLLSLSIQDLIDTEQPDLDTTASPINLDKSDSALNLKQIQMLNQRNQPFVARMTQTTVCNHLSQAIGKLWIVEDISQEIAISHKIRHLNEELEERVQQRTHELKEANQALQRHQRKASLLMEVAAAANAALNIETAFEQTFHYLHQYLGWEVGHIWVIDSHPETFRLASGQWYMSDPAQFSIFREASEQLIAQDQINQLLESTFWDGQPIWMENLDSFADFRLGHTARFCGLKTGLYLPFQQGGQAVAMLELFTTQALPFNQESLELLQQVTVHLGYVISRFQMEEDLRKNQKRLSEAHRLAKMCSWDWDLEKLKGYWSDEAEDILGFMPSQSASTFLSLLPPEEAETLKQEFRKFFDTKATELSVEYAYPDHTGQRKFLHTKAEIIYNNQAQPIALHGMLQDITTRKKNELLLEQMRQEAESANRSKSIFLANMSHEIRTPLNAILGFGQLMQRDPSMPKSFQKHLKTITQSGEHLLRLINNILEISKIEAGRIQLQKTEFYLDSLLHELRAMFLVIAAQKNLNFISELPKTALQLKSDQQKLSQILINLLANAFKFTEQGKVHLKVELEQRDNCWYLIACVSDTGPGISQELQERIFLPFEQTEVGLKSPNSTGLGLAICKEYVQIMGGTLTLESKLNQGASFCLEIPVEKVSKQISGKNPKAPKKKQLIPRLKDRPYRILIADDTETNREVVVELLKDFDFELYQANNGKEVLELNAKIQPDLILLDMSMPIMDGYAVMEALNLEIDKPQIVALTASAFAENREKILLSGAQDFVCKPFNVDELLEIIHTQLGLEYKKRTTQKPLNSFSNKLDPVLMAKIQGPLEKAIMMGDFEKALSLLSELPPTEWVLHLIELAEQYQYEELLLALSRVT
jgi:PAS domain S-box-containing protein